MQHPDPDRGRAVHDEAGATDALDWPEPVGRPGGGGGPPAGLPRPPRPPGRRRLMLRRLVGLVAVLCLLGAGLYAYRYLDRTLFGDSEEPVGPLVSVHIPKGAGVGNIGDILDAAGVVSNGQAWALRVRINGDGDHLLPGNYRLHKHEHY